MRKSRSPSSIVRLGLLVLLAAAGVAGAGERFGALVIGVPYEDTTVADVGAVSWIWGSAAGLVPVGNGLRPAEPSSAGSGNAWGMVLASGDFNGDGRPDLVVGAPYADPGDPVVSDAGLVSVCLRTADPPAPIWSCADLVQGVGGMTGTAEPGDGLGAALAVGDFNRDGFDDVAVGVPWDKTSATTIPGAVHVLYGNVYGIAGSGQLLVQGAAGVAGIAETDDGFGRALASGDFNGDGYADLAVGVPGQDAGGQPDSGAVHVFYGSAAGLAANSTWSQGELIGAAEDEAYDAFGLSLAAGDFNEDGYTDLAVGIPLEDLVTSDEGMVAVLAGGPTGIDPANKLLDLLHQDREHVPDSAELGDQFGTALAVGDFDADGRADLAVGCPFEDSTLADVGSVTVFYGSPAGFCLSSTQLWQHGGTLGGVAETGDRFGQVLAAGDLNGDGLDDLAIGVPWDELAYPDAGIVQVLYGSGSSGLAAVGTQIWSQDSEDIDGACGTGDLYGQALVTFDTTEIFQDGLELGVLDRWSASSLP